MQPLPPEPERKRTVLVADANASALEFQRMAFAGAGFEVVGTSSVQETLAALRQHQFDHVVLDAQLNEAVTFIRQNLPTLAHRMLLTAPTIEDAIRVKQRLRCIARPLRMAELLASANPIPDTAHSRVEYASR
jgi:CheY-like chemotaxis protein